MREIRHLRSRFTRGLRLCFRIGCFATNGRCLKRPSLQLLRPRHRSLGQFGDQHLQKLRIIAVLIEEPFELGYTFFQQWSGGHVHALIYLGNSGIRFIKKSNN
jgi:hypothetical protein